jgi:hypothetical protein
VRGALEPAVDLRVELAEPSVHRLDDRPEAAVDLGVAFREMQRRRRLECGEVAGEPPSGGTGRAGQQDRDEELVDHRADER